MASPPGSARGKRRNSNPGIGLQDRRQQPMLTSSASESLYKTSQRQASADKLPNSPSLVAAYSKGINMSRAELHTAGSSRSQRTLGTPRRGATNPFIEGEDFVVRGTSRFANGGLHVPNPLVQHSSSRFNTDRLHAATWLVRTCELKSLDLGSLWRTGGHAPVDKAWKPPPRGMPSMAIIRAATCPYHSLHPMQHRQQREDLVRWCLEGDNAGTGVILFPQMMPKALKEPLARQTEEMRRCPYCQQCVARAEAIYEEEQENREQRRLERRRAKQLRELCAAAAVDPLDGTRLEAAVDAWEFERDNADFVHAEKLAKDYHLDVQELERLTQQRPRNCTDLRNAVDKWGYDPDIAKCHALNEARKALSWYVLAVGQAVEECDGWALGKLRDPQGFAGALGPEHAKLAAAATDLYERHAATSEELRRLVESAPNLEANVRPKIEQCFKDWTFADNDPVLDLAQDWLRMQESMAQRVIADMKEMLAESSASMASDALKRPQLCALSPSEDVAAAEALVVGFDRSCQAAGAIAWGVPMDNVPMPGRSFAAAKAARSAAQEVLSRISDKDLQEGQDMQRFSPEVLGIIAVLVCLLSGLGAFPDPVSTCNFKNKYSLDVDAAKAVISDSQFVHCLSIVVLWIGLGTWKGVPLARQAFDYFRTSMPERWTANVFLQHSHLAATLFEFVVLVLKYETAVQETCWKLAASTKSRCPLVQQPDKALDILKPGLVKSRTVAGAWMLYRGDAEEPARCRQRLRDYARSTQRKIQNARQAVGSLAIHQSKTASTDDINTSDEAADKVGHMTVKLLWPSGEEIGTVHVKKVATAGHLKEKLPAIVPNVDRHRLFFGQNALEEEKALNEQGVTDGCELVLNPLLAQRLEECQKRLQASKAEAANLQKPGLALSAAAVLCACKVDRGYTSETPSTVMTCMIRIITDAMEVVHKVDMEHGSSASSPRTPSKDSCPNTTFAFGADIREVCPKSLLLPMGSLTEAVRSLAVVSLGQAPDEAPLLEPVQEFVSVVHDFYERFMPLYIYLGFAAAFYNSARAASRDADEICTTVGELALAPMIGKMPEPAKSTADPAASLMIITGKGMGQPEVVGNHAMPLAAPHVERAQLAAAARLARLLQSPPAAKEDCGASIRLVIAMLDCYFSPLTYFDGVLQDMAGNLDCNKMSQMLLASEGDDPDEEVPLPPPLEPFQLLVAAFRVLAKDGESDIGLREAWNRVAHAQEFKESLLNWSPLRDSSPKQLAHARALLLPLWGCFGAGGSCVGHGTVRMAAQGLYTWAHFATSMAPLLATASQLVPWHEAALEASAGMQACADLDPEQRSLKEARIWGLLRRGLYFPEEPWRWLKLIGCPDPKGFYQRHRLEPNWFSLEGDEDEMRAAAEEEARLKEEEEKKKAEEEAKRKAEEEARLKAEEDKRRAEEEARLKAEEEKRKAEEEARRRAEEEARRMAEAERLKAEEEARRIAEEEARRMAEVARLKAEEEARRKAEEARIKAEMESKEASLKAEEDRRAAAASAAAAALAAAAAAASSVVLKAQEDARRKAEEDAKIKAEEQERWKANFVKEAARDAVASNVAKAVIIADNRAVEAEEEARRKAMEEARLKAAEEANRLAMLKAMEEAKAKAEEEAMVKAAEAAKLKAEEEGRLKALKLKADDEERLKREAEEQRKAEAARALPALADDLLEQQLPWHDGYSRRLEEEERTAAERGAITAWGEADTAKSNLEEEVEVHVPVEAPASAKKKIDVDWGYWDCLPCLAVFLIAVYTMAFLIWMYLARKWQCFPFSLKD